VNIGFKGTGNEKSKKLVETPVIGYSGPPLDSGEAGYDNNPEVASLNKKQE
jgi:hypothetical protein